MVRNFVKYFNKTSTPMACCVGLWVLILYYGVLVDILQICVI